MDIHRCSRGPDILVAVVRRLGHAVGPHLAILIFHGQLCQGWISKLEITKQIILCAVAADRPDGAVAAVVAGSIINFVGTARDGELAQISVTAGVMLVGAGRGIHHAVGAKVKGRTRAGILSDTADQVLGGRLEIDGGAHHVHRGPLVIAVLPADVEQHRGAAAVYVDGAAVHLQVLVGSSDNIVIAVFEIQSGVRPGAGASPAVVEVQGGVAAAAKDTCGTGAAVVHEMASGDVPSVHLEEHILDAHIGVDDLHRRVGSHGAGSIR